jgi:hypothetical protein
MLKKLSVLRPPLKSPARDSPNRHQEEAESLTKSSLDMLALLKEEQPFYYHGNPIMRFEDLAKFVEFDVSEIHPERVVNSEGFDQVLEGEISKVRQRNKACLGDTYINRKG